MAIKDFAGDKGAVIHYDHDEELRARNKELALEAKIDLILEKLSHTDSSSNKELYSALAAAQSEMGDMTFSGVNKYYNDKYATLSDLVKMSRPPLTRNGLAVYQYIYQDENDTNYMKTVLAHISGQTISSTMRLLPNKNTVQQIGSYLAHARRLCYASMVGLMVHDKDDDDGVACMEEYQGAVERGVLPSYTSKDTNHKEFERISRAELEELERSMADCHDLGQAIVDQYHLASLAELPKSKYPFILGQMRKNVALRR